MNHGRKAVCQERWVSAGELAVPPGVQADPAAFEILRLWAAHGRLAMSMRGEVEGEAEDFGTLLADLFSHACWRYAQKTGRPLMECQERMLLGFLQQARARIRRGGVAEH